MAQNHTQNYSPTLVQQPPGSRVWGALRRRAESVGDCIQLSGCLSPEFERKKQSHMPKAFSPILSPQMPDLPVFGAEEGCGKGEAQFPFPLHEGCEVSPDPWETPFFHADLSVLERHWFSQ